MVGSNFILIYLRCGALRSTCNLYSTLCTDFRLPTADNSRNDQSLKIPGYPGIWRRVVSKWALTRGASREQLWTQLSASSQNSLTDLGLWSIDYSIRHPVIYFCVDKYNREEKCHHARSCLFDYTFQIITHMEACNRILQAPCFVACLQSSCS